MVGRASTWFVTRTTFSSSYRERSRMLSMSDWRWRSSSKRNCAWSCRWKRPGSPMSGKALTSRLSGRAGENAVNSTTRWHAFHSEEQIAVPPRQNQGQGEGNAYRPHPRRSHRRPQSGHHRLAQLLSLCHSGIEGVRQTRLVAALAPEVLARQETRQGVRKDTAPHICRAEGWGRSGWQ